MVCFAVRIFSGVGTHVGKFLVYLLAVRYLTELTIVRYLTELKGTLAGSLTIAFPLIVVKVLYHFLVLLVKRKMNFFAQYTWGEPESKIVGVVKVCPCFA